MTTKEFLEEINKSAYVRKTSLLFHHPKLKSDANYRKGFIEVYEWIDALSLYYMEKEKRIQKDFLDNFEQAFEKAKLLKTSSYQKGALYAFHEFQKFVKYDNR